MSNCAVAGIVDCKCDRIFGFKYVGKNCYEVSIFPSCKGYLRGICICMYI